MNVEQVIRRCTTCNEDLPIFMFHKRATQCKFCRKHSMSEYYKLHKADINAANTFRNNKIWAEAFNILGRVCVYCGESNIEFLCIDHILNDRQQERSSNSLIWKYDLVIGLSDPSKYQVLCHNCNEMKQRSNPIQILKKRIPVGTMKKCSRCHTERDLCYFSTSSYRGIKCMDSSCCYCTRSDSFTVILKCHKLLGGECVCCGENNSLKLHIDHIMDNGYAHRRDHDTGVKLCRRILNGSVVIDQFQLLCANCNYSKMLHGSCIHSQMRASCQN